MWSKGCASYIDLDLLLNPSLGHWIQNCPNNEDPAAADRKRFVRVTGIPRSFLKTVETPIEGEGSSGGAMLTADGGFVRAVPDQYA